MPDPASMEFPFIYQTYIFDIFRRQIFDQSPHSDYLNTIHFPMNLNTVSNEHNLDEINFHKHFSWDSLLEMVNNGDYFFTLSFCCRCFLLLILSKLAGFSNLSSSL